MSKPSEKAMRLADRIGRVYPRIEREGLAKAFDAHTAEALSERDARVQVLAKALREIAHNPTGGVGCNPVGFIQIARAALAEAGVTKEGE